MIVARPLAFALVRSVAVGRSFRDPRSRDKDGQDDDGNRRQGRQHPCPTQHASGVHDPAYQWREHRGAQSNRGEEYPSQNARVAGVDSGLQLPHTHRDGHDWDHRVFHNSRLGELAR